MRIECSDCHNVFSLPDERLPKGNVVKFPCPSCKATITLDMRSASNMGVPSMPTEIKKTKQVERSPRQGPSAKAKPTGEALKKRILQTLTGVLPPMPQVVLRAQKIMSDPGSSLKDLAAVIATDQAISVRALKLANSAYYGLAGKVTSIGHASVLLGIKSLGEIIMMAGTANLLGKTEQDTLADFADGFEGQIIIVVAETTI